ncbi:hypothetical protein TR70_4267 [Burkholderia pseudomallei]|nr:hypothetical protein TR70_4267 [Burkholderia pseudomallei]KGS78116.1 hypothetical protein X976_5879 [Burkholderia pseudomallei MSHR7500]
MEGRRLGRAACDAKSGIEVKPGGARKEADGWWARTGPSGTSRGGPVRQCIQSACKTLSGRPATLLRSAFVFHGIVRRTRTHRGVAGNSNDFSSAAGGFSARRSPRWTPIRTAGRRHGDRRVGRMPRSGMIRRPAVPARPAWRRLGVRGAVAANDGRRRPMRRHHAHAEAIRGCARAARQPALSRIATGVSSRARPGVSLQVDATRNASPLAGRRPSGRLSK